MKKIIKVLPFIIAIFVTVMVTHAYYSTTKTLPSVFKTDGYVFKLNAGVTLTLFSLFLASLK